MTTRFFLVAALSVVALTAIAASDIPSPSAPASSPSPESHMVVYKHHCDKFGGVDSLMIIADGPGVHVLQWSNEAICGRQS
jgi:hypothetical protein